LAATDMDRKLGVCVPLGEGEAGSPSNTLWPGTRPTCMPSFILIRPTVWPQCTNVTDRQDRQNRTDGLIAQGEPFYKRSPKNLHRLKGYNARQLRTEFSDKGWTTSSINMLLKKLRDMGTVDRRQGSDSDTSYLHRFA